MIKRLRIKFVVAAMLSLLLVLMIIVGTASVFSYRQILSEADSTLSLLAENNGMFPNRDLTPEDMKRGGRRLSPELPYESRYFSVYMNSAGNVSSGNTGKIAAIDTSTAIEYAQTVYASGKTKGFIGDYRYLSTSNGDTHLIIFLDQGRNMTNFRTFIFTSTGVSLGGLVAVLCLLIFFSGRIVKPFSENYEKQKRFITDAGHELKTPLTIINADAEVLEMDLGENEWLQDIREQTKRLSDLTNNLIFLARMEEAQPQMTMIDFSLSDMVTETAETFQALAKTSQRTLTTDIQPMLTLQGDEKSLQRLVTILLDNAMKYTDENGTISVSLKQQKNMLKLSVYNTTEHISKENLKHLFDRFYRIDKSRNSKSGGYGLGLSIAAAIANTHKGKISADTDDEKSLTITVVLPC